MTQWWEGKNIDDGYFSEVWFSFRAIEWFGLDFFPLKSTSLIQKVFVKLGGKKNLWLETGDGKSPGSLQFKKVSADKSVGEEERIAVS